MDFIWRTKPLLVNFSHAYKETEKDCVIVLKEAFQRLRSSILKKYVR